MTRPPDPLLSRLWDRLDAWEASFGPAETHPALDVPAERLDAAVDEFLDRLTATPRGEAPGTYPFFHPRYAGQMLKPPHPVATAAYAAALRLNPNNHALDGGPPTGQMEKEVVRDLAAMLGLPGDALGHLTGGGTVANLEALWVAREETGGRAVAASADAHYTHARMCGVLGVPFVPVPADARGRMQPDALEAVLRTHDVGTVVLTTGTTGLGSVDPVHEVLPVCRAHGARVHVDAAYGGFFRLLALSSGTLASESPMSLSGFPAEAFRAIEHADSVVIDPHKHGLQPYGCGAVLFRDPRVGRHYVHDSPYTYFTSDELHLGQISLECSRPGAAAAALWLTLRALPLRSDDGLGPVVRAGVEAARDLAARLDAGGRYAVVTPPETDIVVFAPRAASLARVDASSQRIFDAGMADPTDPVFLSLYRMEADRLLAALPGAVADVPAGRVLRSVLMKPEHARWTAHLADRLHALAQP